MMYQKIKEHPNLSLAWAAYHPELMIPKEKKKHAHQEDMEPKKTMRFREEIKEEQ